MAPSVLMLLAMASQWSGVAAKQLVLARHHRTSSFKHGIAGVMRSEPLLHQADGATSPMVVNTTEQSPRPCNQAIPVPGSAKPMPAVGFIACCKPLHMYGSGLIRDAMDYLKHGGRLLDTAQLYMNEREVGIAVRNSGIPRDEIWVTTKMWPPFFPSNRLREWAASKVDQSLKSLGLDYIDVMYLHAGPAAVKFEAKALLGGIPQKLTNDQNAELWKGLIDAKLAGKIRNIGVCLHTQSEIEHLKLTTGVAPAVAYIWHSPFMPPEMNNYVSWLQSEGIAVSAYGILNFKFMGGHSRAQLLATQSVASQHSEMTLSQAIIRWALDQNYAVVTPMHLSQYVHEDLQCSSGGLSSSDLEILAAAPKWDCHTLDGTQLLMGCAP